jgi:hypothetical protein
MKAMDWQDLDPALAELGEAIVEVMQGPVTHARTRSLIRSLRGLPMEDLAQRLPRTEREDLQLVLEDAMDMLADVGDPNGTHLGELINEACRLLKRVESAITVHPASEDRGVVPK